MGKETFFLAYCDGLADIDFAGLLKFHRSHGRIATITAVHPPCRFGQLALDRNEVLDFDEKPRKTDGWINGGFYVLEPKIFDYIDGDRTDWPTVTLPRLVKDRQLMAFKHPTFWQCMDTPQDREMLEAHLHRQTNPLQGPQRAGSNINALALVG